MGDWVRSTKWAPASPGGGSGGFSVECPATGELGHGKPASVWQEVLGCLLAREVGVAVPDTELGTCGGGATIAVSKVWGAQSQDVPQVARVSPNDYSSDAFKKGLRTASGQLAYHAWIGTQDLKDEHLMVRPGVGPDHYEIAAIDFAAAFQWPAGAPLNIVLPPGPPALIANRDSGVLSATVGCIEKVPADRIRAIVERLPDGVLPAAEKERISTGLVARQLSVQPVLAAAGWL